MIKITSIGVISIRTIVLLLLLYHHLFQKFSLLLGRLSFFLLCLAFSHSAFRPSFFTFSIHLFWCMKTLPYISRVCIYWLFNFRPKSMNYFRPKSMNYFLLSSSYPCKSPSPQFSDQRDNFVLMWPLVLHICMMSFPSF